MPMGSYKDYDGFISHIPCFPTGSALLPVWPTLSFLFLCKIRLISPTFKD
jgi:hypothetical protein